MSYDTWKLNVERGGFEMPDGSLVGDSRLIGIGRSGMTMVKHHAEAMGISDWQALEELTLERYGKATR